MALKILVVPRQNRNRALTCYVTLLVLPCSVLGFMDGARNILTFLDDYAMHVLTTVSFVVHSRIHFPLSLSLPPSYTHTQTLILLILFLYNPLLIWPPFPYNIPLLIRFDRDMPAP